MVNHQDVRMHKMHSQNLFSSVFDAGNPYFRKRTAKNKKQYDFFREAILPDNSFITIVCRNMLCLYPG